MVGRHSPDVLLCSEVDAMDRPSSRELWEQIRAAEATGPAARLPAPDFTDWPTWPFDGDLTARRLTDLVLPEPPRAGHGGGDCHACSTPDEGYLWVDDHWRVCSTTKPTGLAAVLFLEPRAHHDLSDLPDHLLDSMGRAIRRVETALLSLGDVARVHMARWGDGAEHLHLWFFPRPAGFVQGRGTFLTLWDDILPRRPEAEWQQTLNDLRLALRT